MKNDEKNCPFCAKKIKTEAAICPFCAEKLTVATVSPAGQTPGADTFTAESRQNPSPKTRKPVSGCSCLVVILIIAAAIGYYLFFGGSVAHPDPDLVIKLPNGSAIPMMKVEAGSFFMGNNEAILAYLEMKHKVTLTRDFYLAQLEVTQDQWQSIMGKNPSESPAQDMPVTNITWAEAIVFCKKLNDLKLAPDGWKITLPTEAQWEFAARGGNKSRNYKYAGGNNLSRVAWYSDNSTDVRKFGVKWAHLHWGGKKKPNELGLFDMSGNVAEWCLDVKRDLYSRDHEFLSRYGDEINSIIQGALAGRSMARHIVKGGSYESGAMYCLPSSRASCDYGSSRSVGFRLAMVKTAPPPAIDPVHVENLAVDLPRGNKMTLVKIEPDEFTMGVIHGYNQGIHWVKLTRDYYIGATEVTQAQWTSVMGSNPSRFKGQKRPVERVSWNDAMAYCDRLNKMGIAPSGWYFSLPTEAQWEFANRGGKHSLRYKYSGSDVLEQVCFDSYGRPGHFLHSRPSFTSVVASLKPNELGLYDMDGNVGEWCLDWYEHNYPKDPEFLEGNKGTKRVSRGLFLFTSYGFDSNTKSDRAEYPPEHKNQLLGFRIALIRGGKENLEKSANKLTKAEEQQLAETKGGRIVFSPDRRTLIAYDSRIEDPEYVIPDGVEIIGKAAFKQCYNLRRVTIPASVREVQDSAFAICWNLAEVRTSEGLRIIGDAAFDRCRELSRFTIPSSVVQIRHAAFIGCEKLASVTIPAGIMTIENSTFSQCYFLRNVKLPQGLKTIDDYAFRDCGRLKHVEIPSSVTSIGAFAFSGCGLLDLTIPGNVKSVGRNAFFMCRNLKTVHIQNGVKNLGEEAFAWCTKLEGVTIPRSISVGRNAFKGCPIKRK